MFQQPFVRLQIEKIQEGVGLGHRQGARRPAGAAGVVGDGAIGCRVAQDGRVARGRPGGDGA